MREEVIREVEQFLYREARLLDERRFHEWLDLFTDDVHYFMASRTNRLALDRAKSASARAGRGRRLPCRRTRLGTGHFFPPLLYHSSTTFVSRAARALSAAARSSFSNGSFAT